MRRFLARRLPVHRGPAAWNAILGPQSDPVVLSEDKTADFVVVGAGFAGLSAARRLTQLHPGARIVVLDAGRIAEGAAGRNSGFMIDLPHDLASSNPMGTTMRRIDSAQGGNRVITRTCATFRQAMRVSAGDLGRAARVHRRKFDARFPALAGTEMEYSWAGHRCLSLNRVSVVTEVAPGVFSACVQNGLGTARGTLTGIGTSPPRRGPKGWSRSRLRTSGRMQ